jgi:hypothetical protein
MGEDELVVLIVFGTIFAIVIGSQLISLAKKWIDRNSNSYDEKAFDRLAKAFINHKKDSERRLQNIEAIVTDEEPKATSSSRLKETQLHNTIEIDSEEPNAEKEKNEDTDKGGNLRNMLKE